MMHYNLLCTWVTLSCSLSLSALRLWSSASVPTRLSSASRSDWCRVMRAESSSSRSCSNRTSSSLMVNFSCSASRFWACSRAFSSSSLETEVRGRRSEEAETLTSESVNEHDVFSISLWLRAIGSCMTHPHSPGSRLTEFWVLYS